MDFSPNDKIRKILNSLFKREIKVWMIKQKANFEDLEAFVITFKQFRFENKCFFAIEEIIFSLIKFLKLQDYCEFENNQCYTIFGKFIFENSNVIQVAFLQPPINNHENLFFANEFDIFFRDINLSILKSGTCLF